MRKISLSVKQIIISGNSLRGVQKNWEIEEREDNHSEANPVNCREIPSYSSVRQWLARIGLYELQRNKEKREDWIWIIDLIVELGQEKCLVILGVSEKYLLEKIWGFQAGIKHQDVEVLALEIMTSTQGELIAEVLKNLTAKVGQPKQIISDRGSDLYKGIKIYQSQNPEVVHLDDITHQVALFLKKELQKHESYQSFSQKCHQCRQQIQQTELAYLIPPAQRSKSRYFNLDNLVNWGQKTLFYLNNYRKKSENSSSVTKLEKNPKILAKLEWLWEYQTDLKVWNEMLVMSRFIETQLKQQGLHEQSLSNFKQRFSGELSGSSSNNIRDKIVEYLVKQKSKIPGQIAVLASSDVIESLFGKYKMFSVRSPLKELRRTILTIPLSTIDLSKSFIKEALENITNLDVTRWEEELFGQSMLSKRKIVLSDRESV